VKALLLVSVLAVAQQEIAVLLAVGAVVLSEAMAHLLAIAVLLGAEAVVVSVTVDRQATVEVADRLAVMAVVVVVAVIVVANTWVDLLECLNTYKAWSPDKTPLAITQQDQTTHIAKLNLASMSSRNQQYRSMEEGCSI
jgi:glucan phosphoethanolaminetransferase (alkaline phosphatase superfamily)